MTSHKKLSFQFSVSGQISVEEVALIAEHGFKSIICNRPDGEGAGQPLSADIAAAAANAGLDFAYVPARSGAIGESDVTAMAKALTSLAGPVFAYCRSGARSSMLWKLAGKKQSNTVSYDVVIVGGGSAGISTASSLLKRRKTLSIAIVEPSDLHYYQPGWTMVGGGIFSQEFTRRDTRSVMPKNIEWIKKSAATFAPDQNSILLEDGTTVGYKILVACPGISLDWAAIDGLPETLGKNGVTSNYGYDLAAYTNQLVKEMKHGRALFTQPPMPIKCAGAPQKAMYISCNRWERAATLKNIDVQFHNAIGVLFGVAAYVPALMKYIERYNANINFESNLVAIDGPAKIATFEQKRGDEVIRVEEPFNMIHVVPPQVAPDFIRNSPLAAASGFIEVHDASLQHVRYGNIYGLGDACSAPNAKTMAAARKQAPVVAVNALATLDGLAPKAIYDGYGSCPLTVERGKIVLAEFGYGGKLLPSFPKWLINGTKPSRLAWLLKDTILPPIYWHGMLKGREWLAKPVIKDDD